jgi:UDP:flavonoid glycosyltransferase YjiC (YdhE family)
LTLVKGARCARIHNPPFEGKGCVDRTHARTWNPGRRRAALAVMRVLMTTTGYPGHLLPLVPFGGACSRAGHEVCVAAPRAAEALVVRLGFPCAHLPDPPEQALKAMLAAAAAMRPQAGHEHVIASGFGELATRTALPSLLDVVGGWRPDVIVRESHEFAGALAAEIHGIPQVRVALGVSSTEDDLVTYAAGAVDAQRRALGLPSDPHGERLRASPSLTLTPPILEAPSSGPLPGLHRFHESRASARPLPDWWQGSGGPLVYLTFGTAAAGLGFFPDLYRRSAEALADLDARVLVTVGGADPAALGPQPPNVHVARWVPQERVLPHAAAVVCHGGYGSMLGALAHGVPLLALPLFGADQWINAMRVADVCAGIALPGDSGARRMFSGPGPEVIDALAAATTRLVTDTRYATGARRVANDMALLAPVELAARTLAAIAGTETGATRSRALRRAGSANGSRASGTRSSDAARRSFR